MVRLFYVILTAVFLRDYLIVVNFFFENAYIPYFSISLKSGGWLLYLKDIAIVVWCMSIIALFLSKKMIFFSLLIIFLVLLISALLNLNLVMLLMDIRISLSVLTFISIYMLFGGSAQSNNSPIIGLIKLCLMLILLSALATVIEFYYSDMNFGVRLMGLFSNAATNSYVILTGILMAILLRKFNYINFNVFLLLTTVYFLAVLATGTRIAIISSILLMCIYIIENSKAKIFLTTIFTLPAIMLSIYFSNLIAGRGDILDQSNGGRIDKLFNISNNMIDRDTFIFGEGAGYGSNIATELMSNMPPSYTSIDGTLHFILLHFGFFGVIMFIVSMIFGVYKFKKLRINLLYLITVALAISLSVNIFEQTLTLIMLGMCLALCSSESIDKISFTARR